MKKETRKNLFKVCDAGGRYYVSGARPGITVVWSLSQQDSARYHELHEAMKMCRVLKARGFRVRIVLG